MIDVKPNSVLYLDNISVSFDGFKALNALSVVHRGPTNCAPSSARTAPTGTTMMDIITDKTRPDHRPGVLQRPDRSHQARRSRHRPARHRPPSSKPTVFESRTVWDNIEACAEPPMTRGVLDAVLSAVARGPVAHRGSGDRSLTHRRDDLAANLSHGRSGGGWNRHALGAGPKLLLVDGAGGGDDGCRDGGTAILLKEIAKTRSVVVVEGTTWGLFATSG